MDRLIRVAAAPPGHTSTDLVDHTPENKRCDHRKATVLKHGVDATYGYTDYEDEHGRQYRHREFTATDRDYLLRTPGVAHTSPFLWEMAVLEASDPPRPDFVACDIRIRDSDCLSVYHSGFCYPVPRCITTPQLLEYFQPGSAEVMQEARKAIVRVSLDHQLTFQPDYCRWSAQVFSAGEWYSLSTLISLPHLIDMTEDHAGRLILHVRLNVYPAAWSGTAPGGDEYRRRYRHVMERSPLYGILLRWPAEKEKEVRRNSRSEHQSPAIVYGPGFPTVPHGFAQRFYTDMRLKDQPLVDPPSSAHSS